MPHDQASELLPWLVNGTLDDSERGPVLEHTENCTVCRRELEQLNQLRDSIAAAGDSAAVPIPDMRRINARIDALTDQRGNRAAAVFERFRQLFANPWRLGFVVQSALIAVLIAVLLLPRERPPAYTTLSAPDALPEGEYVRIVVDPGLSAEELADILDPVDLVLVDGPSPRGVSTVAFEIPVAARQRAETIELLDANDAVRFVQPITIGAEP